MIALQTDHAKMAEAFVRAGLLGDGERRGSDGGM